MFTKCLQSFPTVNRIQHIAQWYAELPEQDGNARENWLALARECNALAGEIVISLNRVQDVAREPYANAMEMFVDIARGQFLVSNLHCDHPIFTHNENVNFRIVHDVLGHYPSGGEFDWAGENLACGEHAKCLSSLAQHALFTECIGQAAYAIVYGKFAKQKIGLREI